MSKELSEIIELLKSNKLIEAEKKCLKLTENIKNNLELSNIYAVILFRLKKYDQAIDQWKKTTILDPKYFFGFNNLGNVYLIKNELDIALRNYNIAIELKSNYYEAIYNKANIYLRLNNFTEAIEYFDKVLKIKNDYFQAHQGKAIAYKKLFKFKESIDEWQKVYQYNPGNTHALVQKGNLLFDTNRLDEALKAYTDAFKIEPEKPFLSGNIIHTKSKMCAWNNFEKDLSNFKKDILENKKVSSPYVTLTLFDDPKIHLAAAKVWSNEYQKKYNQEENNEIIKNQKKNKIKIGYYSADFRTHAMGHLLVRMFELHNKEKFEIYGFYFGPTIKKDDELSKRIIASFDKYIDVSNKNVGEIVELSKSIGIDIAVDLMCFTGNINRFGIFTKKCAPLQINFLGYPGTSGSKFIDYIIIDKKLISDGNKNYFSEKLIFLPDSYQPNEEEKKISDKKFSRAELDLPESKFVFACFNSHQKINPKIFGLWMKILKKKNDSILWLLEDNFFSEKNLMIEAKKNDVDPKRIIFAKKLPLNEHLSRIKFADLFLDTSPYNAHTTCSDALRQSVPVVTLAGQSFASRVASSLLTTLNLKELITFNYSDYEKLVIKISNEPKYLNQLKEKIKKNKIETNLFKTDIFTKNIENAYQRIFQNYIDGNKVKNFEL